MPLCVQVTATPALQPLRRMTVGSILSAAQTAAQVQRCLADFNTPATAETAAAPGSVSGAAAAGKAADAVAFGSAEKENACD